MRRASCTPCYDPRGEAGGERPVNGLARGAMSVVPECAGMCRIVPDCAGNRSCEMCGTNPPGGATWRMRDVKRAGAKRTPVVGDGPGRFRKLPKTSDFGRESGRNVGARRAGTFGALTRSGVFLDPHFHHAYAAGHI